jgi:hypothetical protein
MLKKQNSFEERRDSIRAKRIITVRHRLVKHNGRKVTDSMWQLATTENMSLSGLLFVSGLVYHPGDIVELQVVMSGVLDIFNGFGKVMRASRNKGGYYQIGVKYVDLKSRRRSAKTVLSSA